MIFQWDKEHVCNVYSVFGCVQVFLLLLLFFMDVFFLSILLHLNFPSFHSLSADLYPT